jgi:Zn-dependent peptidase ImmA (M78 family)
MSYLSDEDYESAARALREKLGVDDQLHVDPIDVLRRLKHHGYVADYVRVPDAQMPDEMAKYDPDKAIIYLRESTYLDAERKQVRARWTIGHEIGHVVFKPRTVRNRSFDAKLVEKIVPQIKRDENHANRFAAASLAPFHRAQFSLRTTPEQIADRFGISLDAADARVEEMTRVYRRLHGIKRELPNSVVDLLAESLRKGNRIKTPALAELLSELGTSVRYEGDACPNCNEFKLIRNSVTMRCQNCGAVTGDD